MQHHALKSKHSRQWEEQLIFQPVNPKVGKVSSRAEHEGEVPKLCLKALCILQRYVTGPVIVLRCTAGVYVVEFTVPGVQCSC